jgi:type VI secretion system secreted protein Hcp
MAVDMFLKINGISGESKDSSHKGEIDVLAWSWGASNSGSTHIGGGGGSGKVNVQDISITKYIDLSSTSLLQACSKGTHIQDAILTIRKAGDTPLEYLVINLSEVMITSISTGGSGGEDRLTENVTLNFAKFKVNYTEQLDTGGKGTTGKFGFDITGNTLWA